MFREKSKFESHNGTHNQEIIWEWKSNTNPWSSEPAQWTPYKLCESNILEKAYQNKEGKVILSEWIVYMCENDMFQQKKDNESQQRPVRRIQKNIEKVTITSHNQHFRIQRFIGGERPKTYTDAFGSLDDYLSFFENRTLEMAKFAELFKKTEVSGISDSLNQEIVQTVIDCICKEDNKKITRKKGKKSLVKLFEKPYASFVEFYGDILKAYSMDTFLYVQLNEYLRNEDWTHLSDLLPYAFCLCKAFQCSELASTCNRDLQAQFTENQENPPLILYRGAQFDEASLNCYRPETVSTFSWNAMTSTSTNSDIAHIFSHLDKDKDKISVIFTIEVPLNMANNLKKINLIDMKTHSEYPGENEIVLAPGSIFELISFARDDSGAQVNLRLVGDTSLLAVQGKIMPGAMHAQVSKGKVARIICQEGKELAEALYHLKGNKMIEELEFRLCKYNQSTLKAMTEVISTLTNITKLTLLSNSSDQNNHLEIIVKRIRELKILSLEIDDRLLFRQDYLCPFLQEIRQVSSLLNVEVNFRSLQDRMKSSLNKLDAGVIKCIPSLTTLTLGFKDYSGMTDEEVKNLCSDGLKYLTSLTTLALGFQGCPDITNEGVKSLCSEGLSYLTSLTTLNLSFELSEKITDEGVEIMCSEGLVYLNSLTTLILNFSACTKITDGSLEILGSGLRNLPFLEILALDLSYCQEAIERGMYCLCSEGLSSLTSLITLDLNFTNITDEGVKTLCSEGLVNLIFLTTLVLNLWQCEITNESMQSLGSGLRGLVFLEALTLDLRRCWHITDEGVKSLCSDGVKTLTSLTTLNLALTVNSRQRQDITDEGVKILCTEGLKCLTSLTILNLDFRWWNGLTDIGVKSLCSEGLRYLTLLTTLTLNFENCYKITDEGVKILGIEGLRSLTSLTVLALDFNDCQQITDKGVKSLCSELLINLTSLRALNMNFLRCDKITDEGANYCRAQACMLKLSLVLCYKAANEYIGPLNLKRNSKSTSYLSGTSMGSPSFSADASLSLDSIPKISDFFSNYNQKGKLQLLKSLSVDYTSLKQKFEANLVNILCSEVFKYLTSLTTLTLYLGGYSQITNENMESLGSGVTSLTFLETLTLNFRQMADEGIKNLSSKKLRYLTSLKTLAVNGLGGLTDEGMRSLCSELRYLTSLKALTVNELGKLTDEGMRSLCSELRYLTSLTTLTLDFSSYKQADEGVKSLCSEGLRYLTSLTTLTLNFDSCFQLTDNGVKHLCSQGFTYLTSLASLALNFRMCPITDEGVKHLCLQGPTYMSSLTTLALDFTYCVEMTERGVNYLFSERLRYLTSLTTLTLHFAFFQSLTDEGIQRLCTEGLRYLTSLTSLTLNFRECRSITDEGLKILCSEGIRYLTALKTLNLDFSLCSQISVPGFKVVLEILHYFQFYD